MMLEPGQQVEYAVHGFHFQDDGEPLSWGDEDWRPATVVTTYEVALAHGEEHRWVAPDADAHHLATGHRDVIARLRPDDPNVAPLDLNVKLVRPAAG